MAEVTTVRDEPVPPSITVTMKLSHEEAKALWAFFGALSGGHGTSVDCDSFDYKEHPKLRNVTGSVWRGLDKLVN